MRPHERQLIEILKEQIDRKERGEAVPLPKYADDSAGGLMTPECVVLSPVIKGSEAITLLRSLRPPSDTIAVLFVVDEEKKLLGRLTPGQLLLSDPESGIGEVMEGDVLSVTTDTDKEECVRVMERYALEDLPVVDDENRLAGHIHLKDCLDVAEEEATEDMYRMIGLSEDERVLGPMRDSIKRRLPWLLINLGTAVLAGFVVAPLRVHNSQSCGSGRLHPNYRRSGRQRCRPDRDYNGAQFGLGRDFLN